jgi:hypothetical protein
MYHTVRAGPSTVNGPWYTRPPTSIRPFALALMRPPASISIRPAAGWAVRTCGGGGALAMTTSRLSGGGAFGVASDPRAPAAMNAIKTTRATCRRPAAAPPGSQPASPDWFARTQLGICQRAPKDKFSKFLPKKGTRRVSGARAGLESRPRARDLDFSATGLPPDSTFMVHSERGKRNAAGVGCTPAPATPDT